MSQQTAILNFNLRQGDYEPFYLLMQSKEGDVVSDTDILATYDDVAMEVRTEMGRGGRLVLRRSLVEGTMIASGNELSFTLPVPEAGRFYHSVGFKLAGTNNWVTFLEGVVNVKEGMRYG